MPTFDTFRRALREIDQALNLVRHLYLENAEHQVLADLCSQGLLPPDLLFVVAIADREGAIVESTRPLEQNNVADQDYFLGQRAADNLFIGQRRPGATGEARLPFSRRLSAHDGSFDGVVIVTVDADYFVSSYEASKLGEHGVPGLLGTDGRLRVTRIGDAARELYGFPLAVLVGLSVDEQMAGAHALTRTYLWWAALGSVVPVLLWGLLGRMSWQLARRIRTRGKLSIRVPLALRRDFQAAGIARKGPSKLGSGSPYGPLHTQTWPAQVV